MIEIRSTRNRKSSLVAGYLTAVALSLFVSFPAGAQTNVGRILGMVTDPSGAPVPGCRVGAVNTGTNISQVVRATNWDYMNFPVCRRRL